MKNFSAKNKIILLLLAWLVLSALMFFYFFKILDGQSSATLASMAQEKKDLVVLQAEDASYKQAQADIQKLAEQSPQPEDFFSRDIALVNELQTLENLALKYNVKMQISGVSGTVGSLPKAATATSLAMIPYSIALNGDFFQVMQFLENYEHLSFITNVTGISINAADKNNVTMSLASNFFLRE